MGRFLSTGVEAHYLRVYRSFQDAKKYARNLKLNSVRDWRSYFRSNPKPDDISLSPHNTYKNKGWISWGDFLGSNNIKDGLQSWASYEEAKKFVKEKNIKSKSEWNKFKRSK